MLRDWAKDKVHKSLVESLNRYEKLEEHRKSCFFLENDSEKILEQSQSVAQNWLDHVSVFCPPFWSPVFNLKIVLLSQASSSVSRGNLSAFDIVSSKVHKTTHRYWPRSFVSSKFGGLSW